MTVGLLIVSHSARLAEGVVELAAQMGEGVRIVAAGGTDDGGIGTSFDRVAAGLAEADSGDGVAVLVDLGSALLTAETAVEVADAPERIRIADAPIVEGAVAAAVAAREGEDLAGVVAAAEGGEAARAAAEPGDGAAPPSGDDEPVRLEVVLENEHGLHLRPASELVRVLGEHDAVTTVNGVDASSLLRVTALGLGRGQTAVFEATGPGARDAIAAVEQLVADGFGE